MFLGSGGSVALAPVVPIGKDSATAVWVPAASAFGNQWWSTGFNSQDSRNPWPSYSEDGGASWNVCRLASLADVPPFPLLNDYNDTA